MKIIITSILLLIACTLSAQNSEKTIVQKSDVKFVNSQSATFQIDSVMLSKKNQPQVDTEKTVEYYDDYIKALETKIAFVKGNESLAKEAETNGWFLQMDSYLNTAKLERSALIKSK
jgi:hypothetical protein